MEKDLPCLILPDALAQWRVQHVLVQWRLFRFHFGICCVKKALMSVVHIL